ncbi:hypothetical protein BCV72DRAFT_238970 [Rhizopus microsporus var. microsporus]|uniref:Uncharacterized protein n=1 Tax=Rhizopus microsporus var. microsporus TaxID=86635 RepID=A0A1X0RE58_RHIZD|nr:hypothetical protein BCV72DRAFT_238970 [Rhizopus microsporus var. microsporus]
MILLVITNTYLLVIDIMRNGFLSKNIIDVGLYKGVLGVHVVGFQITFCVTTLLTEEMRSFFANLEDLTIRNIYKQCRIRNEELMKALKKKDAGYESIKQLEKTGKSRN